MTYLLDVNVLIALFDTAHVHHEPAHTWFATTGRASWATCPITENGFIRVVSNPSYPTISATPGEAAQQLRDFCQEPGHAFWNDDISLLDSAVTDLSQLTGHQQITDSYLAALAARQGSKLATFDTRIPVGVLVNLSGDPVEVIPSK